MAISKVKLPNNSSQELHDYRISGVDSSPSSGSGNVVTSGGVYTSLAAKQDKLTFDSEPTENSTNPVTSGGVYESEIAMATMFGNLLNGKESTTNKVTSLSSSSTDTQYPSAKCVYDLLGDVESLINAL